MPTRNNDYNLSIKASSVKYSDSLLKEKKDLTYESVSIKEICT